MTKPIDGKRGLTYKRLRELLYYNQNTGLFIWRVSRGKKLIGTIAGDLKPSGYVLIGIDGELYRAHRLAWLYVTGGWPMNQIDHKNNIRSDNRWANLRIANNQLNQANSRISKNNTAGAKGVYWSKQSQKFVAKINPNREQVHLGYYNTVEEASHAYKNAAEKFFGEFARAK